MKKIQLSTNSDWRRKILPIYLAVLLLGGCAAVPAVTETLTSISDTPALSSAPAVSTDGSPASSSASGTTSTPDPEPIPDNTAYRWDPYCFDRLEGEYEADAKLLADAILNYADSVALSSPASAQIVTDNIAFEFPPSALANYTLSGSTVQIAYLYDLAEHERQLSAFETAVNRALSSLSAEDGELQRAKQLYDYVVQNVAYFSTDYTDKEITAFSALVAGETICYGFADAFGYLLRQTGMEAHLWRGGTYTFTGFSDHGWCYAKVDGEYYHFDPTWERSNYTVSGVIEYKYFGVSDKRRFSSLSKSCVSGFGALEAECDVTGAPGNLEFEKN